ncbi:SDR family NAD(P)-dependent oxidoreductase [Allonocardiopsis opalescens]|uniref:NAD(P)-dependent dehydrogenase (Short-subunit alcohol dehydrogenase family) n=1 Tax=Allonocardiopsis opalescens TaxID=1144618 RepID=A0A2T0PZ05_9ACTN|nr:SDR family NAD(P)-dependent oxidoreductase [Allonocardiopsis opalescens]PRX96785.1 NAD(P)-dependent dehydrogenase (short-subunit alcohol dehydrogenase family) [Allonocardiopsis opalescens]
MASGRVALVTGGSRGIGASIALRLAAEGVDVAVTYERAADRAAEVVRRVEAAGRRGLAIRADSADAEQVVAAVEETVKVFGRIDVLVNNAGIYQAAPVEELTAADVDRMLAIHVRAVVLATGAAVRSMAPGGRIISIGSNLAERATVPGTALYAAGKSALTGFTRALAREVGGRGITAVVVHPGSTDTDMNPASSEYAAEQIAVTALERFNGPGDIAATVAFLAGEGGRNITGTAITVDAGANA